MHFWSQPLPPSVTVQNRTVELKNTKMIKTKPFQTVRSDRREIFFKKEVNGPHVCHFQTQDKIFAVLVVFFPQITPPPPWTHTPIRPSRGTCSTPSAPARPWEPWSHQGGRNLPAPSFAYVCPRWSHNPGDCGGEENMVLISTHFKSVVRWPSGGGGAGSTGNGNLLLRNQSQIVGGAETAAI